MRDDVSEFVSIHTLANRFEADLLTDALEKEGVPVFVRSFEETPYDGLFVAQRGWGLIMVPEASAEKAKGIVRLFRESIRSRGIFTDPSEIDPVLWRTLRASNPKTICANAQVQFDTETGAYRFVFLRGSYLCYPEKEAIELAEDASCPAEDFNFYLSILHYLLEAQPVGAKGKWVSEKELPGGELFFRGHHRIPIDPLKDLFGNRPDLFAAVAHKAGAVPVDMGDLAFEFQILPRISMVFVLWKGDEEFDPELKVLFDETINRHLHSLDTIWAFVGAVSRCLKRMGRDILKERDA